MFVLLHQRLAIFGVSWDGSIEDSKDANESSSCLASSEVTDLACIIPLKRPYVTAYRSELPLVGSELLVLHNAMSSLWLVQRAHRECLVGLGILNRIGFYCF